MLSLWALCLGRQWSDEGEIPSQSRMDQYVVPSSHDCWKFCNYNHLLGDLFNP